MTRGQHRLRLVKRFMQIGDVADVSQCGADAVHFDHHLERRVPGEDRQYAGWTPRRGNAIRAGGEPVHSRDRKGAVASR